jgi:NodT family efflux transporter outer membrane factor (OMF) lipoprotein
MKFRNTFFPGSLCMVAALTVAACAVGPDFKRPDAPAVTQFTPDTLPATTSAADIKGGEAQKFDSGRDIPAEWWTLFQSPTLNTLIEQAVKSNPDLQSAVAALRVAKENTAAQVGAYFPTIEANPTAARYHNSAILSPTLNNYQPYFNLYGAQVSAEWTLDIWGGNRRAVESLKATADMQRFEADAAYLTLTSALAAAAIQEASLREQLAATQDIVKEEVASLDVLKKQLSLGQVAGSDVAAQEAALAQAQQTLPSLRKQLEQEQDLITVLAGRFPNDRVPQTFELDTLVLPQELPVSVPSNLVEQRPDIRAAEESLHSASAQIGVAVANMLPNLTLSAADGTTATQLAGLFAPGNGYWTLAAGLTQPVFDGGTLLHKTRAARAAYDQAFAQYRATVLSAFQNVADTLYAIQSDADALRATVASRDAAEKSLNSARLRLRVGDANVLVVLNAEQTYQQAVISLAQARAARFADTVALFQALGGGWWTDLRPGLTDQSPRVIRTGIVRSSGP